MNVLRGLGSPGPWQCGTSGDCIVADVFLSYSRADRPKAEQVAKALEAEGFTVWWDKVLRAGQTYDEVTEGMLRDAKVVVVLWSEVSVKSKWVRAEATLGERTSAVIPAMIQDADRPIMFELTQTADLIGWDGDRDEVRWKQFVADIQLALGSQTEDEAETAAPAPTPVASAPDATIENTFWTSIEDGDDPADFQAYLDRYPDGHFEVLARNRLKALAATAAPSQPASKPEPDPKPATPQPTPSLVSTLPGGSSKSPPWALIGLAAAGLVVAAIMANPFAGGADNRPGATVAEVDAPAGPSTFADCETCPEMIVLSQSAFLMGSPETEAGRTGNESPMREVSVSAFAIGKTEVTFDQWDICVAEGGCNGYTPPDRGFGRGNQPVIGVSWSDARAYTRWLSQVTGRDYRLPSEAEWEYAARGDTATAYWWGDTFDASIAPTGAPRPVSSLTENPFGLQGTLGNAREWVEDCYINSYANAWPDSRAQRSGDCARRVLRGGAWSRDADDHRAANRARIDPSVRDKVFGFRVATSSMPET